MTARTIYPSVVRERDRPLVVVRRHCPDREAEVGAILGLLGLPSFATNGQNIPASGGKAGQARPLDTGRVAV